MTPQTIAVFRKQLPNDFIFQAEVFNKAIWGDMGEDSAQIALTIAQDTWHLAFIRTQSGEPSPFDDFVCNIIDQYEKNLLDDEVYDMLALHTLLADFESACTTSLTHR